MIVGHLVGVWLLSATWVNVGTSGIEELSEPLEIRTYETRAECFEAVDNAVKRLQADVELLRNALRFMPGSNAITLQCTKQAVEI